MEFIKRNLFFVILCVVFLSIALGLGGYKVYAILANQEVFQIEHKDPDTGEEPAEKEVTEFTYFSGEYERNSGEIFFNWTLNKADSTVDSIFLYYVDPMDNKESELLDVSDYSSYRINASIYQILPGSNTFKIKAVLSNGKTLEKTTTVKLPLVLDVTQTIKDVKPGEAKLTLSYKYGKNNEVKEPRILIYSDITMNYKVTKTDTRVNDKYVIVTQEYTFTWDQSQTITPFTIRWYFADIELNKDFTADFSKSE